MLNPDGMAVHLQHIRDALIEYDTHTYHTALQVMPVFVSTGTIGRLM